MIADQRIISRVFGLFRPLLEKLALFEARTLEWFAASLCVHLLE